MKLLLRRTGGTAGIPREWRVGPKHFSSKNSVQFQKLLNQARFFKLPSELKDKSPARDAFWYELFVEENGRRHSVRRCEALASLSFQKCVRWIVLTF
ncbi:MAG: hypothetical protein AUJ72_04915 [Candidatus Omnitrophica bacterium CG1_02_46_14]|nr:MAG: hypothetical protein AUJ72_04915 [Candidatus Omnitrophica bacterium CG1_02_46_14]